MGFTLPLSGLTGNNRWQLDLKTEKVTSLSPGQSNLENKQAKLQTSDKVRNIHTDNPSASAKNSCSCLISALLWLSSLYCSYSNPSRDVSKSVSALWA